MGNGELTPARPVRLGDEVEYAAMLLTMVRG
jgi:hypothetical protein